MGWFWADENPSPGKCPVSHDTAQSKYSIKYEQKCREQHDLEKGPVKYDSEKCPVKHYRAPEQGKCPVDHNTRKSFMSGWFSKGPAVEAEDHVNPLNNMPNLSQQRAPGQKIYLPTERTLSSIPKGTKDDEGVWEYPSPQQMLNAMLRKGGGKIPEDAVESMVDVHNFLNEGTWQEILQWEEPYTKVSQMSPRLLRFTGRPNDMSPRAQLFQFLGKIYPSKYGHPPPFDRHDWTVLRGTKEGEWQEVRYVIDYYAGPDEGDKPTFILDVRPALDSVSSAIDRFDRIAGGVWKKAMGRSDT